MRSLIEKVTKFFSQKVLSLPHDTNHCIEVQTSPADPPSVPPWFAEVVIIV
jgi:hypothetical protein